MYDDCRVLLNEELGNEIDNLSKLTPGTKEHTEAVEAVVKLYRAKLDEDELTRKSSEFDEKKETDLKESAKERKLKYGSVFAELGLSLIFTSLWGILGFVIEKDGNLTSQTFRTLRESKFSFLKRK